MKRIFKVVLFIILLICLLITLRLFAIGGVVADENNLGGAELYGGSVGLAMAWVRMLLLLIGTILSFLHIFED